MMLYYDHYKDEGLDYCWASVNTAPNSPYNYYKFKWRELSSKGTTSSAPIFVKVTKFEDLPSFIQDQLYKDNLIPESDSEDDEYSRYKMT